MWSSVGGKDELVAAPRAFCGVTLPAFLNILQGSRLVSYDTNTIPGYIFRGVPKVIEHSCITALCVGQKFQPTLCDPVRVLFTDRSKAPPQIDEALLATLVGDPARKLASLPTWAATMGRRGRGIGQRCMLLTGFMESTRNDMTLGLQARRSA